MFVVDALNKVPWGDNERPPYLGPANPPVAPAADGHFDRIPIDTRGFSCATMYATVRRVLDIWEDYFGRRIDWHFQLDFERLLLIPLIDWDNAQSGYGFLEFGYGRTELGGIDHDRPYCQNFDVLAHELGHSIVFAEVTARGSGDLTYYGGFHESAGDLVAIVASLHFEAVVDHLLANSSGNLFTANEISRVGELSESRQIRTAFNYDRMSTVSFEPHDLSMPLTGGIFDVFVEVFQNNLVADGLITKSLADRSYNRGGGVGEAQIQKEFDKAFKGKAAGFKQALLEARDYLGRLLARTWPTLVGDDMTYADVGLGLLSADRALTGGANGNTIRDAFNWREIDLPNDSPHLKAHRLTQCGFQRPITSVRVLPAAPAAPSRRRAAGRRRRR